MEVVAAILIGFDKSLLPGAGILGIAMLAAVEPAKTATGTTLTFLIVADWSAIWAYRKDANWHTLLRLLPNVIVGVILGAGFLQIANNSVTRRTIGVVLLVFIALNFAVIARRNRRRRAAAAGPQAAAAAAPATAGAEQAGAKSAVSQAQAATAVATPGRGRARHLISFVYGSLAGFTTMVANAGGPVTAFYFLAEGFPVVQFLGTTAWFYLIMNLIKLPFSLSLGMITPHTLLTTAAMLPVIVATVICGRVLAKRIDRRLFNTLIYILTVVTAIDLVI